MKLIFLSSTLVKFPISLLAYSGHNRHFVSLTSNLLQSSITTRNSLFLSTVNPTETSIPSHFNIFLPSQYSRKEIQTKMSSASSMTIEEAKKLKKSLRTKIRSQLKSMTSTEIQSQSQQVWDQLYQLPAYQSAKCIGLFLSMPQNEIQTESALKKVILKDHKEVYIPRVGLDFEKCDMDLIKVKESSTEESLFYTHWPRNKWGIPEPPAEMKDEERAGPDDIDVLIVPGLAFDKVGSRLGQGKGYYDRFISRVRTINGDKKSPLLVAVAMKPQFLKEEFVPILEHDFQMDVVITPETTIVL